MLSLLVALVALLPFAGAGGRAPVEHPQDAQVLPCYPDTVEVIEQQIVGCDTTYTIGAPPLVTCRVILCVPLGVDLNQGRDAR